MKSMIYRGFTWKHNPETSSFKCDRSYIKHKYPELDGTELEDFGPNAVVITGSGEFFGTDAYSTWRELYAEYKKHGVCNVSHPVFTDVTRGLMTSLTGDLEARDNYIRYSFEMVADTEPDIDEKIKSASSKSKSKSKSKKSSGSSKKTITYVVKKGDYLIKIANAMNKKYGCKLKYQDIAKQNKIKNPNLIYVGQKLKITVKK